MSKKLKIRRFSDRERCSITPGGECLTEQHHKDDCDINMIVKRATQTGIMPGASGQPQYLDCPAMDYHQALELVREADGAFAGLPSEVRAEFGNDPYALLTAIELAGSDDDVKGRLQELGVIETPVVETPAEPMEVRIVDPGSGNIDPPGNPE